jgi:hypothetical protein
MTRLKCFAPVFWLPLRSRHDSSERTEAERFRVKPLRPRLTKLLGLTARNLQTRVRDRNRQPIVIGHELACSLCSLGGLTKRLHSPVGDQTKCITEPSHGLSNPIIPKNRHLLLVSAIICLLFPVNIQPKPSEVVPTLQPVLSGNQTAPWPPTRPASRTAQLTSEGPTQAHLYPRFSPTVWGKGATALGCVGEWGSLPSSMMDAQCQSEASRDQSKSLRMLRPSRLRYASTEQSDSFVS